MASTVTSTKIVHIDDDPCLNSIVTESILPLIPDRTISTSGTLGGSGFEHGSSSNENYAPNCEGNVLKVRSGTNYNTPAGSNARNTVKGTEGTQVSNFLFGDITIYIYI